MKALKLFAAALIVFSTLFLGATTQAAETILLRWAHYIPETPEQLGASTEKFFAAEVNKRTDGKVKIEIYFSETLGKVKEMLGLVKEGTVDISSFPAGYFQSAFPLWAAPNTVPFVMSTVDQAHQVGMRLPLEIPAVQEEIKKQNVKLLYHHTIESYQLFARKPVVKFEDFKGLKVRTWGEELPVAFKAAGAVGVMMTPSETYEGLQRKVIDATMWPYSIGFTYRHHEVAPHISNWNIMSIVAWGVWMNMDTWNKLPSNVQKVIQEVVDDTNKYERNRAVAVGDEYKKRLEAAGAKIYDVPASERKKWVDASPNFVDVWVKAMEKQGKGDAAKQMRERWLEIVAKH